MLDLCWSAVFASCLGQLEPRAQAGSGEWGDAQLQGLAVALFGFLLLKDLVAAGSI